MTTALVCSVLTKHSSTENLALSNVHRERIVMQPTCVKNARVLGSYMRCIHVVCKKRHIRRTGVLVTLTFICSVVLVP